MNYTALGDTCLDAAKPRATFWPFYAIPRKGKGLRSWGATLQINLFDLNLIRSLDALLSEGNVTRAAEKLCVTQQAMSGSLRRLRDHFSDELLVRVGRHLELTPLGIALRQPMRELTLQIGLALDAKPVFDPTASKRRFRIAMSDYAGMTLLPHLMPLVSRRAPGIVCEIRPIDDLVFRDIERGNLDFCLLPSNWRLYQSSRPEGLRSLTLFEDDFVCVADKDHPDLSDIMTSSQYVALPHNIVQFGGGVRSIVEDAWSVASIAPVVAATATSFASLLFMVPGTRMIATAQRKLVMALAPLLPIRILECPIVVEPLQEDLSWHARNETDPAHLFMRGLFADAAAAMDRVHGK